MKRFSLYYLLILFLFSCSSVQTNNNTNSAKYTGNEAGQNKQLLAKRMKAKQKAEANENLAIGKEFYKNKRYSEAIDSLIRVINVFPESEQALYLLAESNYKLHYYTKSIGYLKRILKKNPLNYDAIFLSTKVYKKDKRYSTVQDIINETLKKIESLKPDEKKNAPVSRLKCELVSLKIINGKYHEAILDARKILLNDVKCVCARKYLGRAYLKLHKPELALYIFEDLLKIKKNSYAYYYIGNIYLKKKQYNKAMLNYSNAIKINPDFFEAYNNLAALNSIAQNYEMAVENLKKAIEINNKNAVCYLNLGNAYKHLQKFKKAESAYKQAIKLAPKLSAAYFNLGILYFEAKIPDYSDEERYQMATDNLVKYKDIKGFKLTKNDPVLKYIKEAGILIKQARQLKEQMKQMKLEEEKNKKLEEKNKLKKDEKGTGLKGDSIKHKKNQGSEKVDGAGIDNKKVNKENSNSGNQDKIKKQK